MKLLLLLAVAWCGLVGATTLDDLADVKWDGQHIVATPGTDQTASTQSIAILQSEQCPHRSLSETSVEVKGACHYLSGIYRYTYQPPGKESPHRVAVGFALIRGGTNSHAFIVSMPLDLPVMATSR